MRWRNQQMDVLRQSEPLTEEGQDKYFCDVVSTWFGEEHPEGVLFAIRWDKRLIGYGGLVHIDWKNRNAEVSFLLGNKNVDQDIYIDRFSRFLELTRQVASELALHKIYCVGYDIYQYRFQAFKQSGFECEARLRAHTVIDRQAYDVLIHSLRVH